jgi:hypothetical protein
MTTDDPSEYVSQHRDQLIDIIKHSNDVFTRSFCLAALLEYGDDPRIDDIIDELRAIEEDQSDD